MFGRYVDLSLLKICAKLLGKVTLEKQEERKKHLSISKLSFKLRHLCLYWSTLSLIMRIIKEKKINMDIIN